ncbi:MmgE/PrpD family protein [Rhodococcus sp. NPDC057529]|uniref:MmgE/PrpD family protein n=1 Tax=Rhodococcus sp. NPDC057529 TaxID=3346158 RepID=UPI003671A83A
MTDSIVEQLAAFSDCTSFVQLPCRVIDEIKRLVLDSLGCALAAGSESGSRIAIEYGRILSGSSGEATIIGASGRASVFGAAFANAELVLALDYDAVMQPGHVTPYVLPPALALAESLGRSGQDLIVSLAVAHEMSYRFGEAMGPLRWYDDGQCSVAPVFGYSSTVFGATAAVGLIRKLPQDVLASALGIAGGIAPVNAKLAWIKHAPSTTIKHLPPGVLTQTALTAAHLAEFGHRGDLQLLDDTEYGYPRFTGASHWDPGRITAGLGSDWRFPDRVVYKRYPNCSIMHPMLDSVIGIVEANHLDPHEIEGIAAWGEAFFEQPIWLNRTIETVRDAQYSIAHCLAAAAHLVPIGKEWQEFDFVFSPSVLALMDKVTFHAHPGSGGAASSTRVEISARGRTFVHEQDGESSGSRVMTTEELIAKFHSNADGVITQSDVKRVVDAVLNLDAVTDIGTIMDLLTPAVAPRL